MRIAFAVVGVLVVMAVPSVMGVMFFVPVMLVVCLVTVVGSRDRYAEGRAHDLGDRPATARDRRAGLRNSSRRGSDREVEETIRALWCVQLDSITAVERSHRIVLGSRPASSRLRTGRSTAL